MLKQQLSPNFGDISKLGVSIKTKGYALDVELYTVT